MVFDYADNGSLRKYLAAVELDWLDNCQLGLDIINGLRYIHQLGILHKDLVSALLINMIFIYCRLYTDVGYVFEVFEQCINSWKDG